MPKDKKEAIKMKRKYMKWAGLLVAVLFLATMIPANAVDNNRAYTLDAIECRQEIKEKEQEQEVEYDITDVLTNVEIVIDYNPEPPEGGIPPMGDRRSFFYMTGMYEEYEDVIRLVGVWYHHVLWFDGIRHYANLTGLVALELVTGPYTGTHVFPDWYDRVTWIGTPSIFPYRVSIGYSWNPDTARLAYFHCFADYTEDDEHIRYMDRTFTEDWSTSVT